MVKKQTQSYSDSLNPYFSPRMKSIELQLRKTILDGSPNFSAPKNLEEDDSYNGFFVI